jgi:hypothetical protein
MTRGGDRWSAIKGRRRGSEHAAPTSGAGTQQLQVTPENVVDLAVTFRENVASLESVVMHLDYDLYIRKPWLGDPFSASAQKAFNDYFVDHPNSFTNTVKALYQQHKATYAALQKIAEQYNKTEELNQRLMQQEPTR